MLPNATSTKVQPLVPLRWMITRNLHRRLILSCDYTGITWKISEYIFHDITACSQFICNIIYEIMHRTNVRNSIINGIRPISNRYIRLRILYDNADIACRRDTIYFNDWIYCVWKLIKRINILRPLRPKSLSTSFSLSLSFSGQDTKTKEEDKKCVVKYREKS